MRLKTFGTLGILRNDGSVADTGIPRRALALLSVLAHEGAAGATRDRLLGLFWPDREPDRARHLLDQALYTARRALGPEVIVEVSGSLQLNAALLPSDVADFREALRRGDRARAVAVCSGPFLDGLFLTDAPEFERWTEEARAGLSQPFVSALLELSAEAGDAGEAPLAVSYARQAAARAPLSSVAVRSLMEAQYRAGDRTAALDAGRVHAALVREELQTEADPSVLEMMEAIRSGTYEPPKRAPRTKAESRTALPEDAHAGAGAPTPVTPGAERRSAAQIPRAAAAIALVVALGMLALIVLPRLSGRTNRPHIFVADLSNDRLVYMDDMEGSHWTPFGTHGSGTDQFFVPSGIFVDSAGRIYVADRFNARIVRMDDARGKNWTSFGVTGSDRNQFWGPVSVFVDRAGRIYVTDGRNNRVVRFDDMTGRNWTEFGSFGTGARQFNGPAGLFVDTAGRIYVTDEDNDRVVRVDAMDGGGWIALGTLGSEVGRFHYPLGVFVDRAGRIYVADQNNSRVVRVDDMTGTNWSTYGTVGSGRDQFFLVPTVFVDPAGRIYAVDQSNNRIVRVDDMNGTNWVAVGADARGGKPLFHPFGLFVR